jgi:hypothetical protein
MKHNTRLLTLLGSLGLATLLPSCQTTGASAGTDAVMCSKCKTVWVKTPVQGGPPGKGGYTVYRDTKTMTCPDCESAVVTFFKTGSLKHSCAHCGSTLTHCTTH